MKVTEQQKTDLAGNAFCSGPLIAVFTALVSSLDWKSVFETRRALTTGGEEDGVGAEVADGLEHSPSGSEGTEEDGEEERGDDDAVTELIDALQSPTAD